MSSEMQEVNDTPASKLGLAFARAIVSGEFSVAHAMLSNALRQELRPQDLESHYNMMIEYGDGPPDHIEVIQVDNMDGWKSKQKGDVGWAYVAICGDGYNEAVSVVVAEEGSRDCIRLIEWGRP